MAVRFTEEQKACVECLTGPLDISAGAGSGKTFTLTERIASALADPASGADDIDQICAITFTRKAAAELKGRVRSTLRAQGRLDQAMKVDGAWISTIHGMCARILRAEALQLGLDPGFRVMEDVERNGVLAWAMSEVLGGESDIVDGAVRDGLLREFPVRSFRGEASIASVVEKLVNKAAEMPEGFDGFDFGPAPVRPSSMARELLGAFVEVEPFYQACNPSNRREDSLAQIERAREVLEAFVESGSQDLEAFLGILEQFPVLPKIPARKNPERTEAFDACQARHSRVAQNAVLARGRGLLDELLDIARSVDDVFSRRKRQMAVLDNYDLVRLTLRALEEPAVGAKYADRFRLVMVDEFQDTDALQIAIVKHLAGPGMRYLCTVGDAQQSIYRFRGADVNGYRAFRSRLSSPEVAREGGKASLLRLTRNFRSHADVLAFVKRVCAQPCVFGDGFLDLSAAYDGADYRSGDPRVQVTVVKQPGGKTRAGAADRARRESALQVARYFSRMRDEGHKASEMVLLLGGMTNAQVYTEALRRAGFECIVAGGSTFFTFPEVSVVRGLASALANPEDTAALFEVLTSEMFRLSADDLLLMSTGWNEAWDIPQNRKLDRGLAALRREQGLSPALRQAVEVLGRALDVVRYKGLSRAIEGALAGSGWVSRLQARGAEGTAIIANIMKAVRTVASLEQGGSVGPSSAAGAFCALFESAAKDSPGVLNVEAGEAVRIMTIHASKGLEFPLVALAELSASAQGGGALAMQSRSGRTGVSLKPGRGTLPKGSNLEKAFAKIPATDGAEGELGWGDIEAAVDPAAYNAALREVDRIEEAAERQRLFYVAATRAKEAVALFLTMRGESCAGVVDDIRSALFGLEAFPDDSCTVDYGGSQPALYRCIHMDGVAEPDRQGVVGEGDAAKPADAPADAVQPVFMEAPEVAPFSLEPCTTAPRRPTELFSYSSLHAAEEAAVHLQHEAAEGEKRALTRLALKDADSATDFGSALHRLAQLSALRGADAARAQLEAVCRTYGVSDSARLAAALERWLASSVRGRALSFAHCEPELPFVLPVADGVLEGEIDLLCFNEPCAGDAYIVDYKTGGSDAETDHQLLEKHRLQGQCYALAALSAGFDRVRVAFVRVEHDDPNGADSLQQVLYAYEAVEVSDLAAIVADMRLKSTLPTQ